jgi:hypothetical protein
MKTIEACDLDLVAASRSQELRRLSTTIRQGHWNWSVPDGWDIEARISPGRQSQEAASTASWLITEPLLMP